MELFPAEAKQIAGLVHEWAIHPDYELEATFGGKGQVDAVTFINIAQRLRAKGYRPISQEDRLTVMTPEYIRFTLSSTGVIQQYCIDDTMAGKPFKAIIKDRAFAEGTIDLTEYDTRMKLRREIPMSPTDPKLRELLATWQQQRKAFRMIRRWSFEGDGVRYDLSIVRGTRQDSTGQFRWQRRFRDQDIMKEQPVYEVEVELMRDTSVPTEEVDATSLKKLVKGVGEVLRGIQKHTLLMRNSARRRVLANYEAMTGLKVFRGPPPITLEKSNFSRERTPGIANIRDGYNVTDKADGLRCMGFVDENGELFLIDMGMYVYRTSLVQENCRLSLVDGEWITRNIENKPIQQFMLFDIFYSPERKDVSQLPFKTDKEDEGRYGQMRLWMERWMSQDGAKSYMKSLSPASWLQVAVKTFKFAAPGDLAIFQAAGQTLDTAKPYHTDGLIFTPNTAPLPTRAGEAFKSQFKWKPAKDNTIDFLVKTIKDTRRSTVDEVTTEIRPGTNETLEYKTLRLYVGSSENPALRNSRDFVLYQREKEAKETGGSRYRGVPFAPIDFPDSMASICKLPTETDFSTGEVFIKTVNTEEPIQDESIVEMAYDPSQPPGWRWVPLRVRMDKTERYAKRFQTKNILRTLNSEATAQSVWNSIHDPITEVMIRTGSEEEKVDVKEVAETGAKPYFERKADINDINKVSGLREFHNRWIKETVLLRPTLRGGGKSVLDLATGKGADLQKWIRAGAAFCFGIDISPDNINNTQDGAYRRLVNIKMKQGAQNVPPVVFAVADTTKTLVTGDAGIGDEEKDILRAVFGRQRPVGPIPPFISDSQIAGRLREGADCITSMFAIHYTFASAEIFQGFLNNLNDALKVGGYFVGCTFDGDKVFNALRSVPMGGIKSGMDGDSTLWSITKQYDEDDMPVGTDSFGLPIDVKFISIGTTHREYLVPFKYLTERLREIGIEPLNAKELQELGLQNSSATFDVSWEMAKKAKKEFKMSDAEKQFSFMNRWFIFKRRSAGGVTEEAAAATAAAATEAAATEPVEGTIQAPAAVPTIVAAAAGAATTDKRDPQTAAATAMRTIQKQATAAAAAAAAEAPAIRTLPVAAGEGAAPIKEVSADDIFLFYTDAAISKDSLKIGDKGAGRWLALNAPFPIVDSSDGTRYPTVEHYIAGMRFKLSTNKPELAASKFSQEGTIHQGFHRQRLVETLGGTKPLSEARDYELLKEEATAVKNALRPSAIKEARATVDDAKWATVKDKVLADALEYRWLNDARFHKIVEAVRNSKKVLLFYTPGASTSDLGGVFNRKTNKIDGENKVGRIIMKLAKFPGY